MDIESLKVRITSLMRPVIEAMVDYPEEVVIETQSSTTAILVSIFVNKADQGKVIGREGKNAMALRAILNAMCGRYHIRSTVEIVSGADHC